MPSVKNVMTTSRIDHPVNVYFKTQFLRRAFPRMLHTLWGMENPMPQHAGEVTKWRRYASPTAQTTPLVEGEDHSPVLQSKTDISAQVKPYGAFIKVSSWLDLTGMSADGAQRTDWLADQFKRTIDTLCRETISATASTTTASNGSPTATLVNRTDVETVTETLLGNEAMYITKNVSAGTGVGTAPVLPAFVGIMDTLLRNDVLNVSTFRHPNQYGSNVAELPGEMGSITDVRIVLTTDGYVSGSNYRLTIIGQESYGNVKISGADEMLIHLTPDQVGSPLKQYGTFGWKANYACRILNDNWIHALIITRGSR